MPTLNQICPTTADGYKFEGGYVPSVDNVASRELDSLTINNGTYYGPERVVTSALNGIIGPAASQPTATTANTDTSWSFAQQVRHGIIQNKTQANVYFSLDTGATVGSLVLAPGSSFPFDCRVTTVHLLTPATQNINGAADGNIVVWGWM